VSNAPSGYIIQQQEKNSLKFTKVATLDPSTLQYTVENLRDKSEYYFQVFAENSVGLGPEATTELVALATHASKFVFYATAFKVYHLQFCGYAYLHFMIS
jgi:Fibronectin type III domain.